LSQLKKIILKLTSHNETENETTRLYEGEGYKLDLHYAKQITDHNETIFKGKFSIENKGLKTEYEVEGTSSNL
jgi:hypothetical protein